MYQPILIWEYDPSTGQWLQKVDFPGQGRWLATGFVIDGKAYVGCGADDDYNSFNDFWMYDPVTDSREETASLSVGRFYAVGFAIDGKGYVGTGQENLDNYLNDFWQYTPDCEVPAGLTATNIKSTSAKVNWSLEPAAQTYSVRYRKTGTIPWTKTTAQLNYKKLTGLSPDTEYDRAVKSVCDPVNGVSSD